MTSVNVGIIVLRLVCCWWSYRVVCVLSSDIGLSDAGVPPGTSTLSNGAVSALGGFVVSIVVNGQ
jgi:hypothetical protein